MEQSFWIDGSEPFRRDLSEDALMVFPGRVTDKAQTVAAVSSASRWTSVTFSDRRTLELGDAAVALNYCARARRDGEERTYVVLATSVYIWRAGRWQLALHQQSV